MRQISIGISDFKELVDNNLFYIDKTYFLKEWIDNGDYVTLITRPRRFGKTLTMSMVEHFLSDKYSEDRYLFENLYIGQCDNSEYYMSFQGSAPVIFLSFAGIKGDNWSQTYIYIKNLVMQLYNDFEYILCSDRLNNYDKEYIQKIQSGLALQEDYAISLNRLSYYLKKVTGNKVYILLDEYDTPLQNAYIKGYWNELTSFIISFFINTFKDNSSSLKKALITGITRVSKEIIFSALNNLHIVTTTSSKYASCFGFTEEETFAALKEYNLSSQETNIKKYYNGFIMGNDINIYNPWSILNYLSERKYKTYWTNTSSNEIINQVIAKGSSNLKIDMEALLKGNIIYTTLDEDVVYKDLDYTPDTAIWGLLLASGYVKVVSLDEEKDIYGLKITNLEVQKMFEKLFRQWFSKSITDYNNFITAMLIADDKRMQRYLNNISRSMFSYFDTGNKASEYTEPEKFYHGFVLGLMVDMKDRFVVDSNRESGFGRYDVCVLPIDPANDVGIIIEFKVFDELEDKNLNDTALNALKQIEDRKYEQKLIDIGVKTIYKYGIAFKGKECIVLKAD